MNQTISFTFMQLIGAVLGVCAGIVTIAGALTVIMNWGKSIKAPEQLQNQRLADIEAKLDSYDKMFANDKSRLDSIEDGNRVTQRAILALLAHGIDGNEIESMRDAKNELQNYLLSR